MVLEYVYSPHVDFFIDRVDRDTGYEMASFHIHHKYEIYYEIEGSRRYFIEDAAYIVNAGSVVLIGENQIHKTAALGDGASSRIVVNFSREFLDKITDLFPDVDFFSFLSEEHNHLLSVITVKQQNHIQGILQQLLTLQEETSPEADAMRKMLLATLLLCGGIILTQARALNAMSMGEEYALHVGVSVRRVKLTVMICVSAMIGMSVSVGGGIGFVGLVTPHMIRLIVGANHRRTLPACLYGGAIFLLLADLISRTILAPAVLPVGVVTSIIGAAAFLVIFLRTKRRERA